MYAKEVLMGRHRKDYYLTDEQKQTAIELAAQGHPLKKIIDAILLSEFGFLRAKELDPIFRQRFEHARQEGLEHLADALINISDEYIDVNKARLKSDNYKWLLSKRKPGTYGDRIDVNVTQTVDITGALNDAKSRLVAPLDVETNQLNSAPPKLTNSDE